MKSHQVQCGREVYAPRYILGILNGWTIMNFATHTRQLSGLLSLPTGTVGQQDLDETLAQQEHAGPSLGYSSGHNLCWSLSGYSGLHTDGGPIGDSWPCGRTMWGVVMRVRKTGGAKAGRVCPKSLSIMMWAWLGSTSMGWGVGIASGEAGSVDCWWWAGPGGWEEG